MGKGKNGGKLSVYLMGCYDPASKQWKTVTKCGNGLDDEELKSYDEQLRPKLVKLDKKNIPSWLSCDKVRSMLVADHSQLLISVHPS